MSKGRGGYGGFGMGGGMGNMQQLMKQAQKMQKQMEEAQANLSEQEFTVTSGGGAVTVTISGAKEIKSIKLSEEVVDPEDIEMLQDLIVAGVNEALKKVDTESQKIMPNVPGLS